MDSSDRGALAGKAAARDEFRLALGVLVLSGAAALGHELLWTRRLIDLLGASSESSARVFECFFLGLSVGAMGVSFLLPKIRNYWRALGLVELGVAILCLPVLRLPEWTDWIWPSLGAAKLVAWQGAATKTILSVLVLLPPTVLMGMTLPLAAAIALREHAAPNREVWLYAGNTLGGVFGLGAVVLVVLQFFGVVGSMLVMMSLNLIVATTCFWKSRSPAGSGNTLCVSKSGLAHTQPVAMKLSWPVLLLVAFFSGAGVLSLEVLGLAMANLAAPVAIYPQAGILICVILLLAVAAWLAPKLQRRIGTADRVLPVCMYATGVAVALVPIVFASLPSVTSTLFGTGRGFPQFLWVLMRVTFVTFGPAMLLAGTVFPLLVTSPTKGPSPRRLGLLLTVSGLGGIVGAETSYRLLLPTFAVHVSIGIVGLCYALVGTALLVGLKPRLGIQYVFPVVALVAIARIISGTLVDMPVYYQSNVFKVVDMRNGREGSLVVAEDQKKNRDMIFDNRYTLGGSAATGSLRRQSHLPLLFHPHPEKVAFVGFGTGITGSGALEHAAVKSITAVELSALVAQAGERNFSLFNHNAYHDPRVKLCIEDARIYLEAAPGQFDVVVGDLFTPWRPGEASLSSLEQFRAARQALRSGGVFCQWLELTQWTPEQFQSAAATFKKVFGKLYLLHTSFNTSKIPVGLLGFKDGAPDWMTVKQRCETEASHGGIGDPLCRHWEGVAMLYLGELDPKSQDRVNTLGNLRIELSASRQLVAGDPQQCYTGAGDAWSRLVLDQIASMRSQNELPEQLQAYPDIGLLALRFAIASEAGHNSAASLARDLMARMPRSVANDSKADWSLWACDQSPWSTLGLEGP